MGASVPIDSAIRVKYYVCSFVRGMLQDHEGKSELKNHLQCDQ
jgi:hypothetical protein